MEEKNIQRRRKQNRRSNPAQLFLLLLSFAVILIVGVMMISLYQELPQENFLPDSHLQTPVNDKSSNDIQASADAAPWYLTLVNKWNPLPADYEAELVEVAGGERVDKRIYPALQEMLAAAETENLGPIVVSGYRTDKKQQRLLDDKIAAYLRQGCSKNEAKELAEQWVAVPGASEHQLGLAVDINGDSYDIYLWLEQNSYKYGFIYRYPGHKTEITGVAGEEWHYRYVGVKAAAEIYQQGLCLEEYLQKSG